MFQRMLVFMVKQRFLEDSNFVIFGFKHALISKLVPLVGTKSERFFI